MLYWPQPRISMMEGEEDVESKPTQPTCPAYEDLLEVMSHNTEKLDLLWRCERLETLRGQLDEHFLCRHDRPTLVSLLFLLDFHTEWMFLGQSFFADFAIMETNKQGGRIMQGFIGMASVSPPKLEMKNQKLNNITHPMKHPAQSRKDCKFHGRPGHAGHDHKDKTPDHSGHPEHAGHDHKDKKHDHRVHPEHPHLCPKGPSGVPESAPEGHHEFPCHGFVKIPPSIYPICPFPPPRLCRSPPDLVIPGPPPPSPQ